MTSCRVLSGVARSAAAAFAILIFLSHGGQAALKSTGIPRYDASIARSIAYLKSNPVNSAGEQSIMAYALFKAGEDIESPMVATGVAGALARAETGYSREGYRHIYVAGVDAMLLADTDADAHQFALQKIADYIQQTQHPTGFWTGAGEKQPDTSMIQYAMLGLWAAQRAGSTLSPEVVERAAVWHLQNVEKSAGGGWSYRPGDSRPRAASHNMTLAAGGSLSIARIMLYGREDTAEQKPKQEVELKFGVLEKEKTEEEQTARSGSAFKNYQPKVSRQVLDNAVNAALRWNEQRFQAVTPESANPIYYYYAIERALAINNATINGQDWYVPYGDGMLTKQLEDGSYKSNATSQAATSFAILYLVRSTKQILDKQFGKGRMEGGKDLTKLFGDKKKVKKELGPLDELLGAMMTNVEDLDKLDDDAADAVVEKIQISSRDELIGQLDMLKKLLDSRDAENRRTAYWALGRTGDFNLIPLMMQGLRDPSVDCNVEALRSLRFIARKPNGFGLSLDPLAGAETADNDRKVEVANQWRTKAYNAWGDWYRTVRPFDEGGGLDELELGSKRGN